MVGTSTPSCPGRLRSSGAAARNQRAERARGARLDRAPRGTSGSVAEVEPGAVERLLLHAVLRVVTHAVRKDLLQPALLLRGEGHGVPLEIDRLQVALQDLATD